ncbi:hypothetical protein CLOSTASPAR_05268 [[Clostridium] asparagiforme DSM 15981]|uniref:Uncharacterized protein n=1 Tax=[Clostridium] asparagiforme DSM 15981 TaxID=518636 RepID=C0D7M2_9FIRM|nr:hypothetical protein CLOSTASPAR_05268 [[Clostridium] asparagiforme DSM 15981]
MYISPRFLISILYYYNDIAARYNPFLSLRPTSPKPKKNAPVNPKRSLKSI